MGVHASGYAQAGPSAQPPIDTSRNFAAHVSGGEGGGQQNLKHIPIKVSKHFLFCVWKKMKKNEKCLELPPPPEFLGFFVKKTKSA